MRYYEILAVAHPNLEQEGLNKLIDETKGLITKRGGELLCIHAGDRVKISGSAVLYLEGVITI